MLGGQAVLWLAMGWRRAWCARSTQQWDDRRLALWVEDTFPALDHRLISAVELNRPAASIQGMSSGLIAAVTREAELYAAANDFVAIADRRRLGWAFAAAAPCGLLWLVLVVCRPETMQSLLARQFLADVDVPRSIRLENVEAEMVRPAGEDVLLRFRVEGSGVRGDFVGQVDVRREGSPAERYPLIAESIEEGSQGVFVAASFRAMKISHIAPGLATGGRAGRAKSISSRRRRSFNNGPRCSCRGTAVCGPNGAPYEQEQPRGDIAGLAGATATVAVSFQKPVVHARLLLHTAAAVDSEPAAAASRAARKPKPLREIDSAWMMVVRWRPASFRLEQDYAEYRIVAEDRYGFHNPDPPAKHPYHPGRTAHGDVAARTVHAVGRGRRRR